MLRIFTQLIKTLSWLLQLFISFIDKFSMYIYIYCSFLHLYSILCIFESYHFMIKKNKMHTMITHIGECIPKYWHDVIENIPTPYVWPINKKSSPYLYRQVLCWNRQVQIMFFLYTSFKRKQIHKYHVISVMAITQIPP